MEFLEEWRPIRGFPGYEVSNLGRVRSLYRPRANKSKGIMILKESPRKNGYFKVDLYKDGEVFTKNIHRLVAETFIPNPNNLPVVNHKDENKTNNSVTNLEWCTQAYNNNYGSHCQKLSDSISKKVAQYTQDGELVKVWKSATEASKSLGINRRGISRSCNGRFCAGGFKWGFVNNE